MLCACRSRFHDLARHRQAAARDHDAGLFHTLLQPTALGVAWIAMQAAAVLVLADLQWMGLRRGAAPRAAMG